MDLNVAFEKEHVTKMSVCQRPNRHRNHMFRRCCYSVVYLGPRYVASAASHMTLFLYMLHIHIKFRIHTRRCNIHTIQDLTGSLRFAVNLGPNCLCNEPR